MRLVDYARPRRIAGVIGAFTCALAWLGWQFLHNDRAIEDHRVQQELTRAAEEVSTAFRQSLEQLPSFPRPPAGIVRSTISGDQVDAQPANALAYYPVLPERPDTAGIFTLAETAEFRDRRLNDAAILYRSLTTSPRGAIRAGALARLGRVLRAAGRTPDALATFDQLAALDSERVDQLPAALVAREGRCRLFEALGRKSELRSEAALLQADLRSNRWVLLRPAREFYVGEARHWGAAIALDEHEKKDAQSLATAAEWLYNHSDSASPVIVQSATGPVLALWDFANERLHGTLAAPSYLAEALRSRDPLIECALIDRSGRILAGEVQTGGPRQILPSYATGLAWDLAATLRNPDSGLVNYAARRRLLLFGFAVVALVLMAGTYYILRAIAHEQAVLRPQSRFVSDVSHELRTPLSSIVQISEMLAGDRVPLEETAPAFQHLVEESHRLQKLVESLLDFGRMESKAFRYTLIPQDPVALVRAIAADFERSAAARTPRITVESPSAMPPIRADSEALTLAIWNLLDNAVKYSPEKQEIAIVLSASHSRVMISIQDRGMGIPRSEQDEVFKKFFRGSASREANVKGTGIGLAMVRHIAEAHHGDVILSSEPGSGSTFTLRLPAVGES